MKTKFAKIIVISFVLFIAFSTLSAFASYCIYTEYFAGCSSSCPTTFARYLWIPDRYCFECPEWADDVNKEYRTCDYKHGDPPFENKVVWYFWHDNK